MKALLLFVFMLLTMASTSFAQVYQLPSSVGAKNSVPLKLGSFINSKAGWSYWLFHEDVVAEALVDIPNALAVAQAILNDESCRRLHTSDSSNIFLTEYASQASINEQANAALNKALVPSITCFALKASVAREGSLMAKAGQRLEKLSEALSK